ncbi:MAG: hypothetical protein HOQ09_02775 [Gemmatimonadaceae bacterium]|nr:hypothetical protein [Gemmatimonadaceae bacterium]
MMRRILAVGALFVLGLGAACVPKAPPLAGGPAPAVVPRLELPAGHTRFVFGWSYEDPDMRGRGDGAIRAAAPDSARLDLFIAGGLGGATAVLIGDQLRAPGPDAVRKMVPPPPLLWAALGRLAVPPAADTVARLDGDTLRIDIGRGSVWRVTVAGGTLKRLERIDDGRIVQSVRRADDRHVRYYDASARRSLDFTITSVDHNVDFDASIWSL